MPYGTLRQMVRPPTRTTMSFASHSFESIAWTHTVATVPTWMRIASGSPHGPISVAAATACPGTSKANAITTTATICFNGVSSPERRRARERPPSDGLAYGGGLAQTFACVPTLTTIESGSLHGPISVEADAAEAGIARLATTAADTNSFLSVPTSFRARASQLQAGSSASEGPVLRCTHRRTARLIRRRVRIVAMSDLDGLGVSGRSCCEGAAIAPPRRIRFNTSPFRGRCS